MKRSAPLKRSTKPLRRSKRIPRVNKVRVERRAKNYRRVLASDFHKQLRYTAFLRSAGYCECEDCDLFRTVWNDTGGFGTDPSQGFDKPTVWFVNGSGPSWKRFRSKDGELHHTSYKFFGDENPSEIDHVLWVHKACHQRLEAEHSTRRRFLKGAK